MRIADDSLRDDDLLTGGLDDDARVDENGDDVVFLLSGVADDRQPDESPLSAGSVTDGEGVGRFCWWCDRSLSLSLSESLSEW